jgi:hypothetical protein
MDLFSTDVLTALVRSLKAPNTFILDNYFPMVVEEDSEEVHFDVETGVRRLAPFVAPILEGRVVESQGFVTRSLKPAYVKDLRPFDTLKPFKRMAGEALTGSMSAGQRSEALVAQELADARAMLKRRLEWMAIQAITLGSVTIDGEGYDAVQLTFGRDAALTATLLAGARWIPANVDAGTATPVEDIEDMAESVHEKEGATITDVVMGLAAWRSFRRDPRFEKAVDLRRAGSAEVVGRYVLPARGDEAPARLMGTMGDINLWTYSQYYIDPATGNELNMWDSDTVTCISPSLNGVRHFGAIKDHDAGLVAVDQFIKSWVVPNPSVRYLLSQSAPLMVPYRPNATGTILTGASQ